MANNYNYISEIALPDGYTYKLRDLRTAQIYYGTCTTIPTTAQKEVTIDNVDFITEPITGNIKLGTVVFVTFTATNTTAPASLTLKVEGTTAKPLRYLYNGEATVLPNANYIDANQTYQFYYDGTYWVMNQSKDTTLTLSEGRGINISTVTNNETRYNNISTISLPLNYTTDFANEGIMSTYDSNRLYSIGLDSEGNLAVVVPWITPSLILGTTNDAYLYPYIKLANESTTIKFISSNTNALTIEADDTNNTLTFSAIDTTYELFTENSVTEGLVPHPDDVVSENDELLFLAADGTWTVPEYPDVDIDEIISTNYGGTGADLSEEDGGAIIYVEESNDGTILAATEVGTAGQYLKSNGSQAPTWANLSINTTTGVITIDSNTITPITSIADLTGPTITARSLRTNLGLANAMHFIGVVAATSSYTPTDGDINTVSDPKIPTIANWPQNADAYAPQAGDVVLGNDNGREYVYTSTNTWELLGQDASTAYDSDEEDDNLTGNNIFITRIEQTTDRIITATRGQLNTNGEWRGSAATLTNPREIYVDLTTTRPDNTTNYTKVEFNGSEDIAIHVKGILPITHGGTNSSDFDNKRLLYVDTDINTSKTQFLSSTHYIDDTTIGINTDTTVTNGYTLEINGNTLINGNLIPTLSTGSTPAPVNTLGSTTNYWSALYTNVLYIGSTSDCGDAYTPIYWHDGQPTTVMQVIKISFELSSGKYGQTITTSAFTTDSKVIEIVVTDNIQYLNAPLTVITDTTNTNKIHIRSSKTIGGSDIKVHGYILIERGGSLTNNNISYTDLNT